MNERIRELAEQCHHRYSEHNIDLEKFAQLIVQECMEQVWYTREDSINGNISEVIKTRMSQHFGVDTGTD